MVTFTIFYHQYTPNVGIYTIHGSYGLFRCNILHYLQLPVLKKYWEPDCWMWEIHGNPQFTQFNLGHWLGTPCFMTNPQRSHFKDHAIPRWFSPKLGWVSYNLLPFLSVFVRCAALVFFGLWFYRAWTVQFASVHLLHFFRAGARSEGSEVEK